MNITKELKTIASQLDKKLYENDFKRLKEADENGEDYCVPNRSVRYIIGYKPLENRLVIFPINNNVLIPNVVHCYDSRFLQEAKKQIGLENLKQYIKANMIATV